MPRRLGLSPNGRTLWITSNNSASTSSSSSSTLVVDPNSAATGSPPLLSSSSTCDNDAVAAAFLDTCGWDGGSGGRWWWDEVAHRLDGMVGGEATATTEPPPPRFVMPFSLARLDRVEIGCASRRFLLSLHHHHRRQKKENKNDNDAIFPSAPSEPTTPLEHLPEGDLSDNNIHNNHTTIDRDCCLTLVLRQPHGQRRCRYRTLDLMLSNPNDAYQLAILLNQLIEWHRSEASRLRPEVRAIQDICHIDLTLPWHAPLTEDHFLYLCQRWQISGLSGPPPRGILGRLFQEQCRREDKSTLRASSSSWSLHCVPFHRIYPLLRRAATILSTSSSSSSSSSTNPRLRERTSHRSQSAVVEILWDELVGSDPIPAVPFGGNKGLNRQRCFVDNDGTDHDTDCDAEDDGIETLSAAAFRDFLLHGQNESRTRLQDAMDLAQAWNSQVTPADLIVYKTKPNSICSRLLRLDDLYHDEQDDDNTHNEQQQRHKLSDAVLAQDRLTKDSFVAHLLSDFNDLFDPCQARSGADDMTRPLHHYYISTSHTSCHQLAAAGPALGASSSSSSTPSRFWSDFGDASDHATTAHEQSYAALLHRGVRCLDLDVWDGLDGLHPVVSPPGRPPTRHSQSRLALDSVLRVVKHFVHTYPDTFPVVLAMEWHGNQPAVAEAAAALVHEHLGKSGLLVTLPPSTRHSVSSVATQAAPPAPPSPHSLRGKVILLEKWTPMSPKSSGATKDCDLNAYSEFLANDDDMNVGVDPIQNDDDPPEDSDEEENSDDGAVVVGFDESGPIRVIRPGYSSTEKPIPELPELLRAAFDNATAARDALERAEQRHQDLRDRAARLEAEAARFAFVAGWDVDRVRARAIENFGHGIPKHCDKASPAVTATTAPTRNSSDNDFLSRSMSSSLHPVQEGASWESPLEADGSGPKQDSTEHLARFHPDRRCWQLEIGSSPEQKAQTAEDLTPLQDQYLSKAPLSSVVSPTAVTDLDQAGPSSCGESSPTAEQAFEKFVAERASVGQVLEAFLEERALARDLASRFDRALGTGADEDEDEPPPPPPPGLEESWETVSMAHDGDVVAATAETAAELSDYVGSEAVELFIRAFRTRQLADSVAESLAALKEAAVNKGQALEHAQSYQNQKQRLAGVPGCLSRLTYFHSKRHVSWDRSLSLSSANFHSFSHNEVVARLQQNSTAERQKLLFFTKGHLCRVYPPRNAIECGSQRSMNPDPVLMWSLGCQLVACDYRTPDETVLLADGWFRQNGNCGYVLKPAHLRDNVSLPPRPQRWSFRLLSGHYLPPPVDDKSVGASSPFVKLSVYSGSEHETRVSYRTRPVRRGGLERVVWDAPPREVTLVTGSLVSFGVWHTRDDGREVFMGAAVVPASGLREGYRSVPLFNEHHERSGVSCLLVQAERLS